MKNAFLRGVLAGAILATVVIYAPMVAQSLTQEEHQHAEVTFETRYVEPYDACAVVPDMEWRDDDVVLATSFMFGDNGTIVDNGTRIRYVTADEELDHLKLQLDGTVVHNGSECRIKRGGR